MSLRWRYTVYRYDKLQNGYPTTFEGHVFATSIEKAIKAVADVGNLPDGSAAVRIWQEEAHG